MASLAVTACAVAYVAAHAPQGDTVMFSGKRDGSFVFNLRARADRRDLGVLRADKLLLNVAVRRELGVGQSDDSEAQIADRINAAGVHYVVAQSDFWTDLRQMARLQAVLRSPRFEEVARIPVATNRPDEDKELRIYRNLGPVSDHPVRPDLDLPMIGRKIPGS